MQCAKQGVSAKQGSRVAARTPSCGQSVAIPSKPTSTNCCKLPVRTISSSVGITVTKFED